MSAASINCQCCCTLFFLLLLQWQSTWSKKDSFSLKHPKMFSCGVSEVLPLMYYFASLMLHNLLVFIFLMYCYHLFEERSIWIFFKYCFPEVYLSSLLCCGSQWLSIFCVALRICYGSQIFSVFFFRYQYVELKGVHVFFSSDPIYNFPQLAIDVLYSCSGCTLHFNYRGFLYFHFWFSDFTLLFIFFF